MRAVLLFRDGRTLEMPPGDYGAKLLHRRRAFNSRTGEVTNADLVFSRSATTLDGECDVYTENAPPPTDEGGGR